MILHLFHENAADLFPRKVRHRDTATQASNVAPRVNRHRLKTPSNVRTLVITGDIDPEDFPKQMAEFAEDIVIFLEYFNEFPEFTDEAVNASILVFQGDLKVSLGLPRYATEEFLADILDDNSIGHRPLVNMPVCQLSSWVRLIRADRYPRSIQVPRSSTIPSRPILRPRRAHRKHNLRSVSVHRSRQVVLAHISNEIRFSLPSRFRYPYNPTRTGTGRT